MEETVDSTAIEEGQQEVPNVVAETNEAAQSQGEGIITLEPWELSSYLDLPDLDTNEVTNEDTNEIQEEVQELGTFYLTICSI